MSRQDVYKEMEETVGLVPTFFKLVPHSSLRSSPKSDHPESSSLCPQLPVGVG